MTGLENNCRKLYQRDPFSYRTPKGSQSRENMGPLLNEVGALVKGNAEKAEILTAFFAAFLVLILVLMNHRP